jgi:hypothetical protein
MAHGVARTKPLRLGPALTPYREIGPVTELKEGRCHPDLSSERAGAAGMGSRFLSKHVPAALNSWKERDMRAFLIFCVVVLAAYWVDQTYSGGALTSIFAGMLQTMMGK